MRVTIGRPPNPTVFQTSLGRMLNARFEEIIDSRWIRRYSKQVQLILTSPPFPLNRKKKYGNKEGSAYVEWLSGFGEIFGELLTSTGSIVIEMGNAWVPRRPAMSTLALESLLALKEEGGFYLCQEFIWFNPAKLPTPAQWVNVERIRVKDSFTRFWWLSLTDRPKADNRKILKEYSASMKELIERQDYNAGRRPSEHVIGRYSFLKDNKGAIPPNVLVESNTRADHAYLDYCRRRELPVHPARMPPSVAEFFIRFLTDREDLVLDPFGGSCVTGSVAERLGRQWVVIEAKREYAEGSRGRFDSNDR